MNYAPFQHSYPQQAGTPQWTPDYKYGWLMAAMVWVQVYYMVVPENISGGFNSGPGYYRIFKVGLLGVGMLLMLWRSSLTWLLLRRMNPFLLLYIVLSCASVAWSIEPPTTIQRCFNLVSFIAVCISFGLVSWVRTRFQDLMLPILTFLLIASLVLGAVSPDLAIEQGTTETLKGSWRGVTFQKNAFGHLSSFALVLWFHALLAKERKLYLIAFGGGLSALCLLLSRSSTSLLSAVFACFFLVLLLRVPQNLRRYMPFIIATFALIVVTYALAVLRVVPGLEALLTPISLITGKDSTFSNRSVIWQIINEHIQFHPILGTGLGAYWIGPVPYSPSYIFLSKMYFYPTQSHNGYLETINDLGFVGLIVLFGYLFVYVKQALQLLKIDRAQGALYLGLFFLQAIANLSEANWFTATSFEFVIMMISTGALARSLLDYRLRQIYGEPGAMRTDRRSRSRSNTVPSGRRRMTSVIRRR
jgi:exopolysaccharide production protein ExoQ